MIVEPGGRVTFAAATGQRSMPMKKIVAQAMRSATKRRENRPCRRVMLEGTPHPLGSLVGIAADPGRRALGNSRKGTPAYGPARDSDRRENEEVDDRSEEHTSELQSR